MAPRIMIVAAFLLGFALFFGPEMVHDHNGPPDQEQQQTDIDDGSTYVPIGDGAIRKADETYRVEVAKIFRRFAEDRIPPSPQTQADMGEEIFSLRMNTHGAIDKLRNDAWVNGTLGDFADRYEKDEL